MILMTAIWFDVSLRSWGIDLVVWPFHHSIRHLVIEESRRFYFRGVACGLHWMGFKFLVGSFHLSSNSKSKDYSTSLNMIQQFMLFTTWYFYSTTFSFYSRRIQGPQKAKLVTSLGLMLRHRSVTRLLVENVIWWARRLWTIWELETSRLRHLWTSLASII